MEETAKGQPTVNILLPVNIGCKSKYSYMLGISRKLSEATYILKDRFPLLSWSYSIWTSDNKSIWIYTEVFAITRLQSNSQRENEVKQWGMFLEKAIHNIQHITSIFFFVCNFFPEEKIKTCSYQKQTKKQILRLEIFCYSSYLVSDNFTAVNCSGGLGPSSP